MVHDKVLFILCFLVEPRLISSLEHNVFSSLGIENEFSRVTSLFVKQGLYVDNGGKFP